MAEVKVLVEGYVIRESAKVVPTTTLIRDGKVNIIVDPGMGEGKEKVFKRELKKVGLSFEDINIVFTTHYHIDHTQYVGLFPKAKIIDYLFIYAGEKWLDHKGEGYKISPKVSIVHTPGHAIEHASLIVETKKGLVVVAGDVWWFSNLTPKKDPMAWDQKKLEKSRKKVLEIADFIIPGHGKIFRNPKRSMG